MANDLPHCIGARNVITNRGIGICVACPLRHSVGNDIDPPAVRSADGVWTCDRREAAIEADLVAPDNNKL